jgi:DNA-binding transcriptional ArsR family regulator
MQITETTLEILELYRQEPLLGISIRALAQRLGKAYPLIHAHISRLLEAGILEAEMIGRSRFCRLNLGHPQAQHLLAFLASRSPQTELMKRLHSINEEIPLYTASLTKDERVIIVTDHEGSQGKLKSLLPFTNIEIIDTQGFKQMLYEESSADIPQPLIHHALFYEQLAATSRRWRP